MNSPKGRTGGLNGDTSGVESLLILLSFDCCLICRTSPKKEEMVDRRVAQEMRKAADIPEANLLPDVTHRPNKEAISIRCLI
ncbi:hypothetical protein DY000_02021640 [Brassica cretica]|uniref:Uncharacterized protein n=1 Tax=Brassica cretica TaxID=69181 RepID=A0ABQ7EHI1_BRACR|nr:hypothetical protein DY000_02021640 [Brassica cretica]